MLKHTDLKRGIKFLLDGKPYEVLESEFVFKGRGSSTVKAKIRNLLSGEIVTRTFHAGEKFEEIETEKLELEFLYSKKDEYFFREKENPSKIYSLKSENLGNKALFLKKGLEVIGYIFEDKLLNIELPLKMVFKVISAPPGIKGGREQPGTKPVTIETGAVIQAPIFIKEGDLIEINTEKAEYVKRVNE